MLDARTSARGDPLGSGVPSRAVPLMGTPRRGGGEKANPGWKGRSGQDTACSAELKAEAQHLGCRAKNPSRLGLLHATKKPSDPLQLSPAALRAAGSSSWHGLPAENWVYEVHSVNDYSTRWCQPRAGSQIIFAILPTCRSPRPAMTSGLDVCRRLTCPAQWMVGSSMAMVNGTAGLHTTG